MRRHIVAGLSVLTVVAGMGWQLARHPETSAGLRDVRVVQRSEYSQPGVSKTLAAIRIRLSPSDFDGEIRAARQVPQIPAVAE